MPCWSFILWKRGLRFIYSRFFKFRSLSANDIYRKLGNLELGAEVISDNCLSDLPGKTITDLELEIKRFIALLVVNKPVEYVLSGPMRSVWQCIVRHHEIYAKLQQSFLGPDHTFAVTHMEPGGPVDLSIAYNTFHKGYIEMFGTPDPKIWPRIFRHGKGLEGEAFLISVGRNHSEKGPGSTSGHDVRKTVGAGFDDPMAG